MHLPDFYISRLKRIYNACTRFFLYGCIHLILNEKKKIIVTKIISAGIYTIIYGRRNFNRIKLYRTFDFNFAQVIFSYKKMLSIRFKFSTKQRNACLTIRTFIIFVNFFFQVTFMLIVHASRVKSNVIIIEVVPTHLGKQYFGNNCFWCICFHT